MAVEDHARQAALLWMLRDEVCDAPHYTLDDLVLLDRRLEGHLEALGRLGEAAWEAISAGLVRATPGELFSAAVLAFERGEAGRARTVIDLALTSPERFRAVESAVGWIPYARSAWAPVPDRLAIARAAVHRVDPGPILAPAAADGDAELRFRALKAIWQLGRRDLVPALRRALADPDARCRFSACWGAAVLVGDPDAVAGLQVLAEGGLRYPDRAVQLATLLMPPALARPWHRGLPPRLELAGLAALGDPGCLPEVVTAMHTPALARLAGETFTMITGADLAASGLASPAPHGWEEPTPGPDDHLPWPDPAGVEAWWRGRATAHEAGVRHLLGRPVEDGWLGAVLRAGRQRQRGLAALHRALRGRPYFELRAPGFRQAQLLGAGL